MICLVFGVSGISLEPVAGFSPNLHTYIMMTYLRALTSFQGHSLVSSIYFEPVDGFFQTCIDISL